MTPLLPGGVYTKAYRLDSVTYPNGRVIQLNYDGHSGIDDAIGRANAIEEDASGADIVSYTYLGSGRMVRKAYPFTSGGVRLDFIDETGEGSDANDDYEVSLDAFGRPLRYQWETYNSGTGSGEEDLVHIAHAYDRNSNRLYDDRKVAPSYSKVYQRDELNRIDSFSVGNLSRNGSGEVDLDGTTGFASTTALWTLIREDYALDALGNALTVDDESTDDRFVQSFNASNELISRETKSSKGNPTEGIDFTDSAQKNLFEAGPKMTSIQFDNNVSVNSGGNGTLQIDLDTGQDRAAILSGLQTGPLPAMAHVRAPSGYSGSGQAGFVLGYKSDLDYWIYVKDFGDGEWRLYHIYDADSNGSIDYSDAAEKKYVAFVDGGFGTAGGSWRGLRMRATANAVDVMASGTGLISEGGFPVGKWGLYTEIDGVQFDYIRFNPAAFPRELSATWLSEGGSRLDDGGSGDGRLYFYPDPWQQTSPTLIRDLRPERFEVTFSMTRWSSRPYARVMFVFNYQSSGEHCAIRLWHENSDPEVPRGYQYSNGEPRKYVAADLTAANVAASGSATTKVWYRVVNDGTDVKVYSASSEAGLGSASPCFETSSSTQQFDLTASNGHIGFMAASHISNDRGYIDDITVKTDTDANGTYETTELVESFDLNTNGNMVDEQDYDAAGNLTFDGKARYTYDAYNRLVSVSYAYRDSSGVVQVGSTMGTYAYDANNRRIRKDTYLGGILNNVEHFYYIGWSNIETRNGSDQVTQQHVWDNLASHYIDSLAQVANNTNPGTDNTCDQKLYALQDQQFNVLALTDDTGDIVERYEYTLYGQRTVMNASFVVLHKSAYSQQMGFQGLRHDDESGLIQNRNRMLDPGTGRFMQRDPHPDMYPDGLNTYAAYHVMLGGVDPYGLSGGPIGPEYGQWMMEQAANQVWVGKRKFHEHEEKLDDGRVIKVYYISEYQQWVTHYETERVRKRGNHRRSEEAQKYTTVRTPIYDQGWNTTFVSAYSYCPGLDEERESRINNFGNSLKSGVAHDNRRRDQEGVVIALTVALHTVPGGASADYASQGEYKTAVQAGAVDAGLSLAGLGIFKVIGKAKGGKGLTTPNQFFGSKTKQEAIDAMTKKYGSPTHTPPHKLVWYDQNTRRSIVVHDEAGHGAAHIDITRKGAKYADKDRKIELKVED